MCKKHQIEIDTVRILILLLGYKPHVIWTPMILRDATGVSLTRIKTAISWAKKRGFLEYKQGEVHDTIAGRNFLDAARRRPYFDRDILAWKIEVLTGMDAVGERTQIDNAVLTSPPGHPIDVRTPELILMRMQLNRSIKRREATRLGLSVEAFDNAVAEGRIKECIGHKTSPVDPHIGLFHQKGPGRWHSMCNKCRNERRKKKNERCK